MKTVTLGDEYDDGLKHRLIEKLKSMGATPLSSDWKIAGSQEVNSIAVRLRGGVVSIEAETFIGLSVSGPDELVDEIASLIRTSE